MTISNEEAYKILGKKYIEPDSRKTQFFEHLKSYKNNKKSLFMTMRDNPLIIKECIVSNVHADISVIWGYDVKSKSHMQVFLQNVYSIGDDLNNLIILEDNIHSVLWL